MLQSFPFLSVKVDMSGNLKLEASVETRLLWDNIMKQYLISPI